MQIVIPMSGTGSRFKRAGYSDLKPLIDVDGKPMIEHVIGMFPGEHDFLFVCTRQALAETRLRSVLERIAPAGRIVEIEPHKLGPVHAVLQCADFIDRNQPVIVNYCDFLVDWDYSDFRSTVARQSCDGCISAYRGFHPHSLGPNLYAYMRQENNYLVEIAEKRCFTENRMQEYASAGTYYFRSGDLLLHYFQKAVESGLQVNGEYYASLPYNLLVKDGLRVFVYEVKKFLQWGTPEDLEEYLRWSWYFGEFENWRPSSRLNGTTLIPMAGNGVRFLNQGFTGPKPLVHAVGKSILERSLDSLPAAKKWIAVCQSSHLNGGAMEAVLNGNSRRVQIVPVDGVTSGQAASCLLARDFVDPEAPLLIAPCDSAAVYDEKLFAELQRDADCLVWTFRNHPFANRNPKQYGWVRVSPQGEINEILCKQDPGPPISEAAGIVGTFWFRKARYFLEAADSLVALNRRTNGEFYADSCVTALIEQRRRAKLFPIDFYLCFGTPDDVRTYEYWAEYFHFRRVARGAVAS